LFSGVGNGSGREEGWVGEEPQSKKEHPAVRRTQMSIPKMAARFMISHYSVIYKIKLFYLGALGS
jgi:hypothetical protein